MKRRKSVKRILAFVLMTTVFMTEIPTLAFEQGRMEAHGMEPTTAIDTAEDLTNSSEEAYVVSEITEKRESNIKHFRMSNGNITAAVYPFDVHYEDEEGKMQNIDNSLVSEKDGGDDVLSNKKNSTCVKFMKKSNSNKLYTINKNGYKIKVSIEGTSKVAATMEDAECENIQDNPYTLQNLSSQIRYQNVLDSTDIQYLLVGEQLKENIIIKDKADFNS